MTSDVIQVEPIDPAIKLIPERTYKFYVEYAALDEVNQKIRWHYGTARTAQDALESVYDRGCLRILRETIRVYELVRPEEQKNENSEAA